MRTTCPHTHIVLTMIVPVFVKVDRESHQIVYVHVGDEAPIEWDEDSGATCSDCGKELSRTTATGAIENAQRIAEHTDNWPGWEFGA